MSQQEMHKKANLVKFLILPLLAFCGGVSPTGTFHPNLSIIKEEPDSGFNYNYRFRNGQLFLEILLEQSLAKGYEIKQSPQRIWAVLDSGSTQNLMVGIPNIHQYSVRLSSKLSSEEGETLDFHPWGDKINTDYMVLLGQPFFRSHCILMERAIPVLILPNKKKSCPMELSLDNPQKFQLKSQSGQYTLMAEVEGYEFPIALDTGSGISSLPENVIQLWAKNSGEKKKVLYVFGDIKSHPLYEMEKPIHLGKGILFRPTRVFSEKDVWSNQESFFPTLGMDFFQNFRIYSDFGSKIIGIDSHE